MHLNFLSIDRRTAWDIFSLNPPDGYEIIDREEGWEERKGIKIDYRKLIFRVDGRVWLLTGAAWDADHINRMFSFFLYAEARWSDDESEPVSCPEVQNDSDVLRK